MKDFPEGYPRLAAYANSDINTHLYRSFGYVRSRILLYVQDEVSELESQLIALDSEDQMNEPYHLASRRWDEMQNSKRQEIMSQLKLKLKEYDDLILRDHQILKIDRPSRKAHRSYFNYIWNEKPLCEEEFAFIYHRSDMLSLRTDAENSWLEPFVEPLLAITKVLPGFVNKVGSPLFSTSCQFTKSSVVPVLKCSRPGQE